VVLLDYIFFHEIPSSWAWSKNRSLKASAGKIYCTFTVFKASPSTEYIKTQALEFMQRARIADVQLILNRELLLADTVVLKDKLKWSLFIAKAR
jgi:hypothetical protein